MYRSKIALQRLYEVSGTSYPSVTTILGILDKPGLIDWALRTVTSQMREELLGSNGKTLQSLASVADEERRALVDSLLSRAAEEPARIRDTAAALGTRFHSIIDDYIRGETDGKGAVERTQNDQELKPMVESFLRWHRSCGLLLDRAGDTMVISHRYKYAGSLDMVGRREEDNAAIILDIKTSSMVHPSYGMQLAAYANAYREMLEANDTALPRSMLEPPPSKILGMVLRVDKKSARVTEHAVGDMNEAFNGFKSALFLWRLLQNNGNSTVAPGGFQDNGFQYPGSKASPSLLETVVKDAK